ncbi:hypothetical protein K432DRAFT_309072, partial [Lepidopterella palustris CBS 459.81]
VDNNSMTIEACLDSCAAEDLSITSVEYSRECYCGNTIAGYNRPIDRSNCNMACSGNSLELCGGPGALSLYINNSYQFTEGSASVVQTYNGYAVTECWESVYQFLPYFASNIPHDDLTVQVCIDNCASLGYTSAGVEYGQECWCGNATYPIGESEPIGDCNMACLGDASRSAMAGAVF